MKFNDYSDTVLKWAIYPNRGNNFSYPCLGLMGESGEVAEHVKKTMRDDGGNLTEERSTKIVAELGDVLWYCAAIIDELNVGLYLDFQEFTDNVFSSSGADPMNIYHVEATMRMGVHVGRIQDWLLSPEPRHALSEVQHSIAAILRVVVLIATWCGSSLLEVAEANIVKLRDRNARGVIGGSGDTR